MIVAIGKFLVKMEESIFVQKIAELGPHAACLGRYQWGLCCSPLCWRRGSRSENAAPGLHAWTQTCIAIRKAFLFQNLARPAGISLEILKVRLELCCWSQMHFSKSSLYCNSYYFRSSLSKISFYYSYNEAFTNLIASRSFLEWTAICSNLLELEMSPTSLK